jgi:hypothetical protein
MYLKLHQTEASLMRVIYSAVLCSCLMTSPAWAQAPYFCKATYGPGEKHDDRFFGLGMAIAMHGLAQKYCGAKPGTMREKFLGYLEKSGCGPGTEVYSEVEQSVSTFEGADLKMLASNGNKNFSMSPADVQKWAAETAGELGGCAALVKAHDAPLSRF